MSTFLWLYHNNHDGTKLSKCIKNGKLPYQTFHEITIFVIRGGEGDPVNFYTNA